LPKFGEVNTHGSGRRLPSPPARIVCSDDIGNDARFWCINDSLCSGKGRDNVPGLSGVAERVQEPPDQDNACRSEQDDDLGKARNTCPKLSAYQPDARVRSMMEEVDAKILSTESTLPS
jgi:hypothetical protein